MQNLNPRVAWPIFIVAMAAILGVTGYYAYQEYQNEGATEKNIVSSPTSTKTTSSPTPTVSKITHVSDPGVTWLKEPQKLEDLDLVQKKGGGLGSGVDDVDTINYYKIADLDSGGEIDLALVQYMSMGGPELYRFKKDSKGIYTYILKNSSINNYQDAEKRLTSKASVDPTTIYQSVNAPNFLTTKSGGFVKSSYSPGKLFSELTKPKEVIDSEYGNIYSVKFDENNTESGSMSLYLKLADTTVTQYSIKHNFITDDEVALVTWKDGSKNSAKYTSEGYAACGTILTLNVIFNTKDIASRLIEAGKTQDGEKIYTVSKDDPIMKAAYENYKIGRDKDILSLEDLANKKPVFVWKDGFGIYEIFTGRDFAGLAECGKPVIYLYPEKPTQVSVKVGADITKSDPIYENGWQAFAEPSGKLTVAGKVYDYLFWEGTGQVYPNIESGFIVKKENIESTLKDHLSRLGLNQKESADFMEFWLSKMPTTPYTRLTWLGTKEMNQLAPLSVNPKPDTMIRVFLDFVGLNNPINIKPQRLTSISRNGFTLVEWGGLLKWKNK